MPDPLCCFLSFPAMSSLPSSHTTQLHLANWLKMQPVTCPGRSLPLCSTSLWHSEKYCHVFITTHNVLIHLFFVCFLRQGLTT
jgi:hypothetical protein